MSVTELKLSSKVRDFLSDSPLKSFIGGEWVASENGQKITTNNPGSGEPITEFYVMQPSDVDLAVKAADKAFQFSGWATMSPEERGVYVHRLADLIERDVDVIAELESIDGGFTRGDAVAFVLGAAAFWRYYADVAKTIDYDIPLSVMAAVSLEAREVLRPFGVCAVINPWNAPFYGAAMNGGAPLVAGNTLVIKSASFTPLSTLYLARLAAEAGFPAGVINVVSGSADPTGHALAKHPGIRRLSIVGSVEAGKSVAVACAGNLVPVKLELGGKGAALVFEDVDIEDTAAKLAQAITWCSGQICCTATRWIIHEKIYDAFIAAVVAKMKEVKVGDPSDPLTQMGPVVDISQRRRILSYIERGKAEGATVLIGGEEAKVADQPGGYYVQPTLLAGAMDNIAAQEEIFGPVAYIGRFSNEAEGIDMVNSTKFSLANSVWSADLERCNRVAEKMIGGSSWINAHNLLGFGLRFSGVYESGFGGGFSCKDTVRDNLRPLTISRAL